MFSVADTEPPVLFAQIVYCEFVINSVGTPQIVWFEDVKVSPTGRVPSSSQVMIWPGPFDEMTIGIMAELFVAVVFSGLMVRLVGT